MSKVRYAGEAVQDPTTNLGRAFVETKAQREAIIAAWTAVGYTPEEAYRAALFGFRKDAV